MKQVRPKKNLGQHFLVDLDIARRIADTVDEPFPDLPVLEVGPGMGVMTQYLVQKPAFLQVVASVDDKHLLRAVLFAQLAGCGAPVFSEYDIGFETVSEIKHPEPPFWNVHRVCR